MHEWDLRMLDLRQTLPNLKNLLLMLSSPEPPSAGPVTGPGWASGAASRASSRRPSSQYPQSRSASLVWSPHPASRSASIASLVWTPSADGVRPLSAADGGGGGDDGRGGDAARNGRGHTKWADSLAGASVESVMSSASARDLSDSPASPGERRDDLTGQVLREHDEPEYPHDCIEEEDESDGTAEADPESDAGGAAEAEEDADDASSDRTEV